VQQRITLKRREDTPEPRYPIRPKGGFLTGELRPCRSFRALPTALGVPRIPRDQAGRNGFLLWGADLCGEIGMRALPTLAITAFAAYGAAAAGAVTTDPATHTVEGVRNARYCEIIPVVRVRFHLVATVYNTLGLNDCPAAIWDKITEAEMKKHFGAVKVLLNGPRHFMMDKIVAGGETVAGEKIEAGGLVLTERASIDLDLFGMRTEPYRERTIE